MKKKYLTRISLILVISIALFSAIFYGCRKEEEKVIEQKDSNLSKKGNYTFCRGHIYLYTPSHGTIHIGYYMRTYRKSGIMALILGNDCYGLTGNCLPEIVVTGRVGNIDGDGVNPYEIEYFELSESELEKIDKNYTQKLLTILNSDTKEQYNFFMNTIVDYCSNIPQQLITDFLQEKLEIKQFPEGIYLVNKGAVNYNDIPNYPW